MLIFLYLQKILSSFTQKLLLYILFRTLIFVESIELECKII